MIKCAFAFIWAYPIHLKFKGITVNQKYTLSKIIWITKLN